MSHRKKRVFSDRNCRTSFNPPPSNIMHETVGLKPTSNNNNKNRLIINNQQRYVLYQSIENKKATAPKCESALHFDI